MATIRKRNGNWTASVRKKGFPYQYATFDTKSDAQHWAAEIEGQMRKRAFVDTSASDRTTLLQILERYSDEVSTTKKGKIQEQSKIRMICKHIIANKTLAQLTSADIAQYRDDRLKGYGDVKVVGKKTVREELNIIGHAIKIAHIEWNIVLTRGNPVADVRKPAANEGKRDRRLITHKDMDKCEYSRVMASAKKHGNRMDSAIVLALESGMRRSELSGLLWEHVDTRKRVAHLPSTKNGEKRDVPLSTEALRVIKLLKKNAGDSKTVLNLKSDYITHSFIHICKDAGIEDLRWHDLRHEATSRFFELGLTEMEVSSITGHKTL